MCKECGGATRRAPNYALSGQTVNVQNTGTTQRRFRVGTVSYSFSPGQTMLVDRSHVTAILRFGGFTVTW